jgi:hypothetical protein
MLAPVKDQMFHVRIDDRDRERLRALAAHHEVTEGAVVRMLIKQAAEALEASKKKPKK